MGLEIDIVILIIEEVSILHLVAALQMSGELLKPRHCATVIRAKFRPAKKEKRKLTQRKRFECTKVIVQGVSHFAKNPMPDGMPVDNDVGYASHKDWLRAWD